MMLAVLLALSSLSAAETVRVSVLSLFRPQRLVVKPVPGYVLRVEIDGRAAPLDGVSSVAFRREGEQLDCFLRRELIPARRARVRAGEFLLSVPGRIERRYRGTLEVTVRAGVLDAVLSMDLETAVAAVTAAESPPGAPLEALKAQAVVARSYYRAGGRRHAESDFCDTTHCQFLRAPAAAGSPAARAAAETAGVVLIYETAVVPALYSASCGGKTRAAAGGPYPFFAVDCDACRRSAREWTVRLRGEDARAILSRPNDEGVRLEVVRRRGWNALPGNHYEISREGDALILRGRGAGHGAGLCQTGAAAMAADGAGFRAILAHYFPAAVPYDR